MEKEIVIGGNQSPNYNSVCLWKRSDVSHNSNFYIIDNKLFNTRIFIVKGSKEAKDLEDWLRVEENHDNKLIQEKSLEFLLSLITCDDIYKMLNIQNKKSYNEGYEKAQENIRKVLGL